MTTASLLREARSPASLFGDAGLTVRRTDILFYDVAPRRVAIEITVTNLGHEPTAATHAAIQAAPLGAFVPWRPLTVLPVPVLGPGESFVLRTEAARPAPAPLGPPDRVPPRKLLTALGAADERPQAPPAAPPGRRMPQARPTPAIPTLHADVLQLLGRGGVYWAGNLNVFVGGKDVERHMAQALRVYPGMVNLALFVVGHGRPDAYRYHLTGTGEDFNATLQGTDGLQSLKFDTARSPVPEEKWIETAGFSCMMLVLHPPKGCREGSVKVHVTQQSSGREALVEFSLDPRAAGAGCYTL
jgi:hypothetical protein